MAFIGLDSGNSLVVRDVYDEKNIVADIGGVWDAGSKAWRLTFTIANLEQLLDSLDSPVVDVDLEAKVVEQQEREAGLERLRIMSKSDAPVNLRVPGLRASMYNYQRLGVMYAVLNGSGVLLADEMGLGKTLQAMAVALMLKAKGLAKNALIVTPASLKFNWPIEIEKFTDEKYVIIDGAPEERIAQWLRNDVFFYVVNAELLLEDLFGGREFKAKKNETAEQKMRRERLMEKAAMRKRVLSGVRERMWDFLAVDEAQMLKHHSSKRTRNVKDLRARFRMALTGTPMDGRLEELHSVMGFIAPGLLGSKNRFFQRHVNTDIWGKVTGYKRLTEVSRKIQPFFLRRLKKEVLADLPDKIYENRFVVMTPNEKQTYDSLAEQGHVVTEDVAAIVAIIRCKQFCNLPSQVDPDCTDSSKMDAFKEVVDEVVIQNGHKALIFSQYKEMLDVLAPVLEAMGVKYLRIDGGTDKAARAAMQKQFNEDTSIDVMIGTEAMSTGLNFTAADFVINYDDNWSPAVMSQREDRCLVKNSVVFCLQSVDNGGMSLKKIQDVRVGDCVLTHTGGEGMVTALDCHEHRGMITTIEYVGWWEPLVCTHDHKVFVKRGGKLEWVEAHDVLPSDSMAFPKSKDWSRLEKVVIRDNWRLFPRPTMRCVVCGETVEARQMCRIHYREWVEKNRGKVRPGSGACSNGRYVRLPDEVPIDDRWLRLFGWYVAEGFASVKKGKSRFVSLSGHQDEESALLEFGKTLEGVGVRCKIYRNKKTKGIELRAYSGELALWFLDWFGHGAENKSLPVEIMRLPPDQAAVFLRGYTDGDGYQRNRQVEWVSASRLMCYQMCQLAIRSGFIPTMRMVVHPRSKTKHYIGCYTKFGNPDNERLSDQDERYVYRPVRRVETKMDKVKVYDLSVEGDHSFTTGFASVHNCHRIGQRNVVTVVNFICKDTVEERIRSVLYQKNKITAEVLGDATDEMVLQRLGPQEVAKLL